MKERPILFSASMVRALLDGTKTQTRRIVKPQPPADAHQVETWHHPDTRPRYFTWTSAGEISDAWEPVACPYGQPGDRLWVRETWAPMTIGYAYGADPVWNASPDGKWRPPIHMPRAACRLKLEITGVRVERLQDISESDARAEGVTWQEWCQNDDGTNEPYEEATDAFKRLWESINGPKSWDANPWVWVVEFKVVS